MAKITAKVRKEANQIIAKYSGYQKPATIAKMYDELQEKLGIVIPMFCENPSKSYRYELNDEEVENSYFVYSVYEGQTMNDYNMYLS